MPTISLTDFVDFVVKAGQPKFTKVKQIKTREVYDPKMDFWKRLRDGIVEFHRTGEADKKKLDALATGQTDPKKMNRYPEAVAGYRKFLGKRSAAWFDPPRREWKSGDLTIHVNPELGLDLNGKGNIIKLYFKDEKLSALKIPHVLVLMEEALVSDRKDGQGFAVLDVANGKLLTSAGPNPDMARLLVGEAASFVAMWNAI